MVSPSKITILWWCLVVVMLALSVYLLADNAALRRERDEAKDRAKQYWDWYIGTLKGWLKCQESYRRQIKADAKTRAMMEEKP